MSTSHTPGPWHYQENSDAYTHIVRNPSGNMIVVYAPQSQGERYEADARLCAAAPELLELVILANDGTRGTHTVAWQEKARAIISKATGAA